MASVDEIFERLDQVVKPYDQEPLRQQVKDHLKENMKDLGESFIRGSAVLKVGNEADMLLMIKQAHQRLNGLADTVRTCKSLGFKRGPK